MMPTENNLVESSSGSSSRSSITSIRETDPYNEQDTETQPCLSSDTVTITASSVSCRFYLLEPLILLLLFAYNLSSTVLKNQIIYQTCTATFAYSEEVCKLLGTKNATNETRKVEAQIQPYAAAVFLTIKCTEAIVPLFCGLFVGAWADRYGRKPLLIFSYLGYALQYIISAFIAYKANENVMVSPWFFLLSVIPLSCFGSSLTYSVAAVCYISDISTGKERSYRMIAYELSMYIGLMLGALVSGYIYELTSAYVVLVISAAVIVIALFVILFILPESLSLSTNSPPTPPFWSFSQFLQSLKDLWDSTTKPREFNDRIIIILLMLSLLLTTFVSDGSNSVFYLFMRERFAWTVRQFTTYEFASIFVPAVAGSSGLFLLWLVRQCNYFAGSSILWLALISLLSHIASSLMKAFAFVDWQIYLAIGLGVFKSLINPMCRTMITNLLSAEERGKIFSLLSVLQTITPFASSTLYTIIYSISLSSFPGLFNLISANLFGLVIILLCVVWQKKSHNHSHYEPVFR